MMSKKITVTAPDYFVELWETSHKLKEEVASILGVGVHWFEQAKNEAINAKRKELNRENNKKLMRAINYGNALKDMAWQRFRYENQNTDFEDADEFSYDRETRIITAHHGLVTGFLSGLINLMEDFKNRK